MPPAAHETKVDQGSRGAAMKIGRLRAPQDFLAIERPLHSNPA